MELNQIKYFQTIAEEGSFTKAAQKLYLSQPALSKSMARLESELGVELFTRQGMRLELNTRWTPVPISDGDSHAPDCRRCTVRPGPGRSGAGMCLHPPCQRASN